MTLSIGKKCHHMLQPQRETLAQGCQTHFLAAENMFPSKIGDVSTTKSSQIKPVVISLGMVCRLSAPHGTAMAFPELHAFQNILST